MSQADSGVLNNIMICPKCKKQNNKEINIEFITKFKYLVRKRKCVCGHTFTTFEFNTPIEDLPINKVNYKFFETKVRKTPMRTRWQDWRFLCYARFLFLNAQEEVTKFLKKENLIKKENLLHKIKNDFEIDIKSNVRGKILYQIKDIKSKKVYEFTKDIKMRSIREVLKYKQYWENRSRYLHKEYPSEQEKKDEERQFIKSLSHKENGIRAEKYNIDFFREDSILSKFIKKDKASFWELWKIIR